MFSNPQSTVFNFNKVDYCFISLPSRTFVDPHNPQYSPVVCSYCVYGLLSLTNDAISHPAHTCFPEISATPHCRMVIALCQVPWWACFAHAPCSHCGLWVCRILAHACFGSLRFRVVKFTDVVYFKSMCYKSVTVCVI